MLGGSFQFIFGVLQLLLPFIIGKLLTHLATGNGGMSYGVGVVFALGAVSCVSSYSIICTFYMMRRTGLAIKSAVMMCVYQQALLLTPQSRQKSSIGQTTNLMSIDADKLSLAANFMHFLW